MLQKLHQNAKTNYAIRRQIKQSPLPVAVLARKFNLSWSTIKKWKQREDVEDKSSRPDHLRTSLTPYHEDLIVFERKKFKKTVEEIFFTLEEEIPNLYPVKVYRCLARHGLSVFPRELINAERRIRKFRKYAIGYLHIDTLYAPKINKRRWYVFTCIDRVSKIAFIKDKLISYLNRYNFEVKLKQLNYKTPNLAEYREAKNKLVNQKQLLKDKLNAFEQKSNNRFELAAKFINTVKQAEIIAVQENPEQGRDFLKKIGSNFRIAERTLSFPLQNAWILAGKYHAEAQRAEATSYDFSESINWRRVQDSNLRELSLTSFQDLSDKPLGQPSLPCITHIVPYKPRFLYC